MAKRPQPGPHSPVAKPQHRQGLRRPPARPAAGERENQGSERGARYEARGTSWPGEGHAREVGDRGPGRGRGRPRPPRPAALPPAVTAPEPTSVGRTAPNREVRGANHRAPWRGGGEDNHLVRGPPNPTHLQVHIGKHSNAQNRAKTLFFSPESLHGKLGLPFITPFPPAPAFSYGSVHNWASSTGSVVTG